MPGYEDVMQRAADYQSIYAGSQFQCMKVTDLNDPRLGKIFTVRNIEPQRNGQIWAVLSDGSKIPVEVLNSSFNMLSESSTALAEGDVRAMHARLKQPSALTPSMMETLDPAQRALADQKMLQQQEVQSAPQVAQQAQNIAVGNPNSTVGVPTQLKAPAPVTDLSKQLFGMFTLAPTDLEFLVPVKLPSLDLIQMMYAQATDKEEFLTNFSTYVLQNLDLESIKKAMSSLMEPKVKKIRAPKN